MGLNKSLHKEVIVACQGNSCIYYYDPAYRIWVLFSGCESPCRCPMGEADAPESEMNATETNNLKLSVCQRFSTAQTSGGYLASGTIQWNEAWKIEGVKKEIQLIGCEWSLGDGKVHKIGFRSSAQRLQESVVTGARSELILFGGLASGESNTSGGLPDPWIIGQAESLELSPEAKASYRINIAGLGSFKVEGDA